MTTTRNEEYLHACSTSDCILLVSFSGAWFHLKGYFYGGGGSKKKNKSLKESRINSVTALVESDLTLAKVNYSFPLFLMANFERK